MFGILSRGAVESEACYHHKRLVPRFRLVINPQYVAEKIILNLNSNKKKNYPMNECDQDAQCLLCQSHCIPADPRLNFDIWK